MDSEVTALPVTMTAAEILTRLLTVDGAGSGLDADLLQGLGRAFPATEAFSGSSPAAWTDLDLSSIVGSAQRAVLLRIRTTTAADLMVSFRRNGDTADSWLGLYSANRARVGGANYFGYVVVETDTAGIVEWISDVARANTTVHVMAYW